MPSSKNLVLAGTTFIVGLIMGLCFTLVNNQPTKSLLNPIEQTLAQMHEHQYQYSLLIKKLEQQEKATKEYSHSESN